MLFCEEIRANETDRYRLLIEHSPLGILLIDLAGNILDINPRAVEILGSPSAEETKKINMLSFSPLEEAGISEIVRRSLGGEKCVSGAIPYTTKWGKDIYVKFTAVPLCDDNGDVCFSQFVIEDESVTERTRRELCTANRIFKTLIDKIDYLIWMKGVDGKYVQVNRAYAEFCGMRSFEMIGKTDYDIWGEDLSRRLQEDDKKAVQSCSPLHLEEVIEHPVLGSVHFKTIKTPVCDDDDKPCGTVGIAINITEEVRRAEHAREAVSKLTDLLNQNTFVR